MPNVSIKRVSSGAKLLQKLIKKVDNGDGTLTAREARRALGTSAKNAVALAAVTSAINKAKAGADRSVATIVAGVSAALAEVRSANADGNTTLTDVEAKKVKTSLGKQLIGFSRVHGDDAVKDFALAPPPAEYVPTKPFRAPANATAAVWVEAAVKHYNGFANDNSPGYTFGRDGRGVTRYVFGQTETRGLAGEIGKLPAPKAKAALRELSKRILQPDYRTAGWEPKRVWVEPQAQALLTALAKRFQVTLSFKGDPRAPKYDYF